LLASFSIPASDLLSLGGKAPEMVENSYFVYVVPLKDDYGVSFWEKTGFTIKL